jgi:hypothetical protein
MSNHNITQITERAIREYILTQLGSFTDVDGAQWVDELRVYRGVENRDAETMEGEESSLKRYPCITVICRPAEPIIPWRGNWDADCELRVESHASDTTGDGHDLRAGQVFDLFLTDSEICGGIMAAFPNFYAGLLLPGTQNHDKDDGRFVSSQQFKLKSVAAVAMS